MHFAGQLLMRDKEMYGEELNLKQRGHKRLRDDDETTIVVLEPLPSVECDDTSSATASDCEDLSSSSCATLDDDTDGTVALERNESKIFNCSAMKFRIRSDTQEVLGRTCAALASFIDAIPYCTQIQVDALQAQFQQFVHVVRSATWQNYRLRDVRLFGSADTHIFEESHSQPDMDISLDVEGVEPTKESRLKFLRKLRQTLQRKDEFYGLQLISARVPIIAGRYYDYDIDVCVNQVDGVLTTAYIHTIMQLDERVKPLILAAKRIARHPNLIGRGCGDQITGYKASIMIVDFLQRLDPPVLPNLIISGESVYQMRNSDTAKSNYSLSLHEQSQRASFLVPTGWQTTNTDTPGQLFAQFLKFYERRPYHLLDLRCPVGYRQLFFEGTPVRNISSVFTQVLRRAENGAEPCTIYHKQERVHTWKAFKRRRAGN